MTICNIHCTEKISKTTQTKVFLNYDFNFYGDFEEKLAKILIKTILCLLTFASDLRGYARGGYIRWGLHTDIYERTQKSENLFYLIAPAGNISVLIFR